MSYKSIDKTPYWKDILAVVEGVNAKISFEYRVMLHTSQEDINVHKLLSLDIERDYVGNIADRINAKLHVPMGDYVKRIFPFRNNLEITVKRIQLNDINSTEEKNEKVRIERYKAIFLPENIKITGTDYESLSMETLNQKSFVTVDLELVHRSLEILRTKTTSGIFKKAITAEVMEAVMVVESKKITVDGQPALDGFDMVPSKNTEKRDHITIPSFTRIANLPTFLQEKMGGVYPHGIGTYFQVWGDKKIWFVYPLYDTSRFNSGKPNCIIYAVPSHKLPGINRTFTKEGSLLSIVATSDKNYSDNAELGFMSEGTGFRMADARSFMSKPIKITADGPVGNRVSLNHETAVKDREDGLIYADTTDNRISQNPFHEYSKMSMMNIARINVVWENCKLELLYPGMPCKYIFMSGDKLMELEGCILHVHGLITITGNVTISTKHSTTALIVMAVKPHSDKPAVSNIATIGKF
jgi:hypothetical protein